MDDFKGNMLRVRLPKDTRDNSDDLKMKEGNNPLSMETAAESDGTHEPKREQVDGSQVARLSKRAQCVNSARARFLNAKEHSRKKCPGQQQR